MKNKEQRRRHTTPINLRMPLATGPLSDPTYSIDNSLDITQDEDDLTIYTRSATSVEPYTDEYITSYKRYVCWNSIRFMILCGIILGIACHRQFSLHNYYNKDKCCFCFEMAYINEKYSKSHNHTVFEWQSCEYDFKIKQKTIKNQCFPTYTKTIHNIENLSINFDLFGSKYYYMITALIVFTLAMTYAIIIWLRACKIKDKTTLVRDSLYLLLYNIIISIMCFYQILIDYQYYQKYFIFDPYYHDIVGLPTPEIHSAECYVNALNKTTETIIKYVLISAGIYFLIPCFVQCFLHCTGNNILTKCMDKIYNWLIFGCFAIITITFFGLVIYYTYDVLKNFEWESTVLIIIIDIGLIMSFFDILFFKIRDYAKIPFMKILRLICCCYYKYYDNTENYEKISFRDRFPSISTGK
eukprot:490185_1